MHWLLGCLVLLSFLLNEAVGSVPLYLALGVVCVVTTLQAPKTLRALTVAGLAPWLVPLLALVSTAWSEEHGLTLRLSLELIATVAMALVVADKLDPDAAILAVFVTTGLLCIASLGVHNVQYDGMTGRVTWAGIYHNKNSLCTCAATLALASAYVAVSRRYGQLLRSVGIAGIFFGLAMAVLARAVATIAACVVALMCFWMLYLAYRAPPRHRTAYFEFTAIALIVGAALGAMLVLSNADLLLGLVGKDATLTGRTLLWAYANRFSEEHPILGVGYQAFWVQGHSEAEALWGSFHIQSRGGFSFHSIYNATLIELGYTGIVLAAYYFLRTFGATIRWTRAASCPASIFFLSYTIYMGISSLQAPGLFGYFDASYAIFVIALAYASKTVKASISVIARQDRPSRAAMLTA
jgi:exopolysaccharide production protein ExoQ